MLPLRGQDLCLNSYQTGKIFPTQQSLRRVIFYVFGILGESQSYTLQRLVAAAA
ncbi:hypothetical protein PM082_018172 [Marasmius tenuissimus]|nr:hypothetical protein PM082_018172 [Marasmius tenuissimus]